MCDHLAKEPRKPDSLLISLKELRKIETNRIDTERHERERLEHEQRVAAKQAALKEKEEAERKERLREEQVQASKESQEREQSLRLAEAERRARVEAEMLLERERLQLEMATASAHKKQPGPWGTISIVLVVLLSGGLAIMGYELHRRADVERESELQQTNLEKVRAERLQSKKELVLAQAQLRDQRHQISLLQTRVKYLRSQAVVGPVSKPRPRWKRPKRPHKSSKPIIKVDGCNPNDPICGILGSELRK